MAYYKDLREQLSALETRDKLVRIKRQINKDTELMPLVRWQFRGLREAERKAFLFENVVDGSGKRYKPTVAVACYAASTDIYAIGLQCKPEEVTDKLLRAQRNPIGPRLVESGPVHEEVHMGDRLLEHGGLEEIPVPISTPGFDNAPYFSAGCFVTKDAETGVRNVGVYRGMVKSNTRVGVCAGVKKHLGIHRRKAEDKGATLPCALVIGGPPSVGYCAITMIPYGTDEYAAAGGIAGEPLELVKCKTVDIEVPASAEIVIEGEIPVDKMEREGPFGEYTGYMGLESWRPFMNVTCITHRKNPIYAAFISQFPPSESSKLKELGYAAAYLKFLKYDCGIDGVVDIAWHEESGTGHWCVIKMKRFTDFTEHWRALNAANGKDGTEGKVIVLVDDDIDPRDLDSVVWAISTRMEPHRDIHINQGKGTGLDHSAVPPGERRRGIREGISASSILIDATLKWGYPPVALPKKEFMDRARAIWEEEKLPTLSPKVPWFGYNLGYWTEELAEESDLALKGRHYLTGEKLAKNRVPFSSGRGGGEVSG